MPLFGGVRVANEPDLENVRKLDLLAIPMIRRARRLGMAIDREYAAELSSKFSAEILDLERDIASYIPVERVREFSEAEPVKLIWGDDIDDYGIAHPSLRTLGVSTDTLDFNANSPEQIGKLLFDMLNIGTERQLKRTNKGAVSTGKKQLELVKLEHPVVGKVLRHRELSKLRSTYADKLPRLAVFHPKSDCCPVCELPHRSESWRIHGEMGTTRAATGRINHKNPNLGNIPTRTADGQAVQAMFIAPPGMRLLKRDLSQIELRCLAHLSRCSSMIQVYLEGGDLHDDTCHRALGVPWDEKPDKFKHRMAAKRVNFGIQNGTTEKGLYLQLVMDFGTNGVPIPDWLTEEWCKKFIAQWLEARPEVVDFFELCWYRARRYELAWEPLGRIRPIPEVRSYHSWIRAAGLRQAQNFPVTSLAAGQLKLAMGKVDALLTDARDAGMWAWPLLTIHDAIMVEVEEEHADAVNDIVGYGMDTVMDDEQTGEHLFRVPIESDGDVMERWE